VDKFEMAELYIAELENHYTISDELKSQLYSLRDNEKKKSLPSEPVQDD
jgi:hypothetical protein